MRKKQYVLQLFDSKLFVKNHLCKVDTNTEMKRGKKLTEERTAGA